jgi:hypothetical protein
MDIANRSLRMRNGSAEIEIPIRIFAPVQKEADAWSCQYQIGWPEGREAREIWGVDSMQAVVLAIEAIGSDIYTSTYHKAGVLFFDGPGKGYGFPVPGSLRDLLIGDDATFF